jgi:hypothetical protein
LLELPIVKVFPFTIPRVPLVNGDAGLARGLMLLVEVWRGLVVAVQRELAADRGLQQRAWRSHGPRCSQGSVTSSREEGGIVWCKAALGRNRL